jgi:type II restriction enzyme
MTFDELLEIITKRATPAGSFISISEELEDRIFAIDVTSLLLLLEQIGSIPESIDHDSSAEKLFAKAADVVLARSLHELGLRATVNKERADCADVIGRSDFDNYSLVGDAKAFRLSRTAKNQKDFKVKSMADWRSDHNFAVLVCPYFHYPKRSSQIYGQAIDANVCLLSWEHIQFFVRHGLRESSSFSLAPVWGMSAQLADQVKVSQKNRKDNFHRVGNELICSYVGYDYAQLRNELLQCKDLTIRRAETEIEYWTKHVKEVEKYTREQAITELISSLKVHEKIASIRKFIRLLPKDESLA